MSHYDDDDYPSWMDDKWLVPKLVGATALCGLGAFAALRYKVAGPSEYIVRTGLGIKDLSIQKKALQLPFQTAKMISIAPTTFPIEVDAMSAQRIPFGMPSVWTIGPRNDHASLENYARLLSDKGTMGLEETVTGVIHGEIRVLTANIDLNDLFADRDTFKNKVVARINEVVDPFGLHVYNANIAELKDMDEDNRYFAEQKQRALQYVNQEARVATSEAIRTGTTGEAEQQKETNKTISQYDRETVEVVNLNKQKIAAAQKDLDVAKAVYAKDSKIAEIEADAGAEKRRWELQQEVESMRKNQETARLRATDYTHADVQADVKVREAEGQAQAVRIQAEANRFAQEQLAEASLYTKQKEAEGILAERSAEAEGLRSLVQSAGGDIDSLNKYTMVRDGMLPELAGKQAEALKGMKPTVTVWNTGGSQNGKLSDVVTDLFKTGMPLFDGIKQQTGYDFLAGVSKAPTTPKVTVKQENLPTSLMKPIDYKN